MDRIVDLRHKVTELNNVCKNISVERGRAKASIEITNVDNARLFGQLSRAEQEKDALKAELEAEKKAMQDAVDEANNLGFKEAEGNYIKQVETTKYIYFKSGWKSACEKLGQGFETEVFTSPPPAFLSVYLIPYANEVFNSLQEEAEEEAEDKAGQREPGDKEKAAMVDLEAVTEGTGDDGTVRKDLGKLPGHREISLSKNWFQDDLTFISPLTNCTNLHNIDAAINLLRGSLPDSIANLSTYLYGIDLEENQIHGSICSSIRNLVNLSSLSVAWNYLIGPISSSIGRLHKLQALGLHQNKFTQLPSSLGNLTSLIILYLRQNSIHGNIPTSLGNCHRLLELDLSQDNLNGPIPPEIMKLSTLSELLWLGQNALSGSLPLEIGSLKNLGNLDVSHKRLLGSIPNTLGSCLSLEWFELENNSFEREIPQSLRTLRGLRVLDLSHNNLSGLIPSYLGEFQLDILNLSFNRLHGQVLIQGVFQNTNAISVVGNNDLCGGIAKLDLSPYSSSKSSKNKLSHKLKMILVVVVALVICATLLWDLINKKVIRSSDVVFLDDQTIEDFSKGNQPEQKTSDLIDMDPSPSSLVDDEMEDVQPPHKDVDDDAALNEI
ncbi:receptor kinase-like protein Xa21 [Camellia sinensis]|uniref:receptor kinase-like protein Xa21 n=1 Tax=Camellia sinensis TaxID=4442 RepID=UPI00103590D5|nr:receptor kinase-like protein Xa21 [Camellia sinensis]